MLSIWESDEKQRSNVNKDLICLSNTLAAPGPSQPQSQLNQSKPNEIDDKAIDQSTLNEYENEIDWPDGFSNRQDTNQSSPYSAQ
jgi:hypothetical protein